MEFIKKLLVYFTYIKATDGIQCNSCSMYSIHIYVWLVVLKYVGGRGTDASFTTVGHLIIVRYCVVQSVAPVTEVVRNSFSLIFFQFILKLILKFYQVNISITNANRFVFVKCYSKTRLYVWKTYVLILQIVSNIFDFNTKKKPYFLNTIITRNCRKYLYLIFPLIA